MSAAAEFTIGSEVACTDGICGELKRVVVDPVARTLTHLVVEPKHQQGAGRLVPIDLAESTSAEIRLRCTLAEFEALEAAEETRFLPGASGEWGYAQGQILSWPYYGLGAGGMGLGYMDAGPQPIIEDRVPVGEVELRRGERIHASDGTIGRIHGLVIDRGDHRVTHILLDEGHLLNKKRVAVPIGAVQGVEDGVRLNLTRDEVRDLPPVDLEQSE